MDIQRKIAIARKAIASIAEHDDLPESEVEEALAEVSAFVKADAIAMVRRRELKTVKPKT